eukprot:4253017-Pyramimonas_sp.AAC.1
MQRPPESKRNAECEIELETTVLEQGPKTAHMPSDPHDAIVCTRRSFAQFRAAGPSQIDTAR